MIEVHLSNDSTLLVIWVCFLIVGLIGAFAAVVWAVRTGQFFNQQRARDLALRSRIPERKKEDKKGGSSPPGSAPH